MFSPDVTVFCLPHVEMNLDETISKLYDVKGLKFGQFTVRTGELTPVYIDMRVIWSYPDIVIAVSELIWEVVKQNNFQFDAICGLPYQGLPIATYLSTKYNIPMLMKRQQLKTYGTCRMIEGHYKKGDRVLLLDDVIMTRGTLVDDIPVLEAEGLDVVGTVVFFDRDQGGTERTQHIHNKPTLSVVTLPKALDLLQNQNKLSQGEKGATLEYLQANRFDTAEYGVTVATGDKNGQS